MKLSEIPAKDFLARLVSERSREADFLGPYFGASPITVFELSRKRQARATGVSEGRSGKPRNEGVRWNDTTMQANAGRMTASQPL